MLIALSRVHSPIKTASTAKKKVRNRDIIVTDFEVYKKTLIHRFIDCQTQTLHDQGEEERGYRVPLSQAPLHHEFVCGRSVN